MATRCIICERETGGTPIAEDAVIKAIRAGKQALRMAQNNRLVVCNDCMEGYRAKRERFEKSLVQNIVLGGIIFLGLAIVPIFTKAGFQLGAALVGLLFLLGLVLLTVLTSYSPSLVGGLPKGAAQSSRPGFFGGIASKAAPTIKKGSEKEKAASQKSKKR
jgi:hypothetical protein